MALYRVANESLAEVAKTTFAEEGMNEPQHLQSLVRNSPAVIEKGLMVVAEQFSSWDETKRRIDLLALDRDGQLVVIELKRDEDAGTAELQAVRYAALVANMTFAQLVDAHTQYRNKRGLDGDSKEALLKHLDFESEDDVELESAKPRIVLFAADFSRELTTSVMWLNSVGIDIRCVRARPYKLGDQILVDVVQVIPLPEQEDFLIRLRSRVSEEDASVERKRRARTMHVLADNNAVQPGTELVIFPGAVDGDYDPEDDRFKAVVGENPKAQKNVIWRHDNSAYSLSALSDKLRSEGMIGLWSAPSGHLCWSLAADTGKHLYQLAEELHKQDGAA